MTYILVTLTCRITEWSAAVITEWSAAVIIEWSAAVITEWSATVITEWSATVITEWSPAVRHRPHCGYVRQGCLIKKNLLLEAILVVLLPNFD